MKTRFLYQTIFSQKNTNKVSVIIGPRQVGKTTLLRELHKNLGGLFLDLDLLRQYEQVASYEAFLNTLKLNGYTESQTDLFFVFLDEFQRYADISLVLKNVYDHHKNIKIFITGSSSLAIQNSVQESLAGRKIVTRMYPLSFREFLIFKEKESFIEQIDKLSQITSSDYFALLPGLHDLLREFLIFGGYPDVVLQSTPEKKQQVLEGIFDLYVKKDLVDFLKIEKMQHARRLIQKLAVNHGGIANYHEYGTACGLDDKAIKHYIEILQETFLIMVLRPFFTNKNKEISKAPKIYFLDNGVRNYFFNNFNSLDIRTDTGVLFESFIISEILKNGENADNIKYYRNKQKVEVDCVIEKGNSLIPIEIKYTNNAPKSSDLKGLTTFMEEYDTSAQGYCVNLKISHTEQRKIRMVQAFYDQW